MLKIKATKILYKLIKPQWYLAVKALVLAMIVSTLEGISAALVMPFIQILQNGGTSANFQFPYLLQVLTNSYTKLPEQWQLIAVIFSFFGLTVVKNISQYFSSFNINDLQLKVGLAIRQECSERFLELELPFYTQSNLGELLSYVNEQAQRSEALSSCILEIGRNLLIIAVLLGLLISLSPALTIITVISLVGVILILQNMIKLVRLQGHLSAKSIEIFSSIITEIISGIRLVKSFNTEARELERTKQSLQNRYEAELAAYRYNSAIVPLTETTGITVLLGLMIVGSSLLSESGNTTLPVLLTYTLALLRMLPRISHLNRMRSQISLLSGSLEAIYNFLSRTSGLHLPDGTQPYEKLKYDLAFENVTFTYSSNSEPTLINISLPLKKGTTTAIVGPSGSGKSTLADLVMRFHDPDTGSIKVDGLDLREFKLNSWRQAITMVSQDTFLFNASVRENIGYGCPEATELEILEAAKKAYAYEFVKDLPQGFDTIVGNRGTRLSGGQRQRIAIARAILRNPDILVLDEATSALDSNSERIVQKALEQVSRDRTVMVIAHRLSTIEKANNIVVLCNGRVVEQGTHQELLALQGEYCSLYKDSDIFR
jgi:ABC-type multidrug transport system fused ATPase/permease subunit